MAGTLVVLARQSPLNGGTTVAGAKCFVYDAGTTTKRAIYTTSALSVQHANPVVADANGRFAAIWLDPDDGDYKTVFTISADSDPPAAPIWTEDNIPAAGAAVPFFEQTAAETSAAVTPSNTAYQTHAGAGALLVERYGVVVDSSAAASANSSALTNVLAVAATSGCKRIRFPAGTVYIASTLDLNGLQDFVLEGVNQFVSILRLVDSAANDTNIVRLGQFCTVRNLWIRGNWDAVTAGLLGKGIYAFNTSSSNSRGINLENAQVTHCKSYGVHIQDGAYQRLHNVFADTCGLDIAYFEGLSAAEFTTLEMTGGCRFSDAPNGYGLRLKNVLSQKLTFIIENAKGVLIEGDNRLIKFDTCYFENASGTIPYIFNTAGGGCTGIIVENCWLSMPCSTAVFQGDANYTQIAFLNNANLTGVAYLASGFHKNCSLVVDGGRVQWARGVNSIKHAVYTSVGNVGTGEDILATYSLPADTLYRDGAAIRIAAWGKTAANANNKTVTVTFGAFDLVNTGAVAANDRDWKFECVVIRTGGSAERFASHGVYNGAVYIGTSTAPNEPTSAAITISVTGEATSDNDVVLHGLVIEFLDAQSDAF